ncbi:restriction endonuclease subunit S [Neptunomonas phycophila]|uniref:Restriction endonuclease subunit S n=1 Tax=Neptunomonas phycophila TaxID=1572645 RepID=A0ABT9EQT1_9GAMM|nr:restriction endonuclease subunit S [Neptunomonas phycophila]MDP2521411.1 restriction endonuclease subunit S [Neptunomonas phycophila]
MSDVTAVIDCKHRTPVYLEAGIPLVSPGTIKWGALDLVSPVKRVSQDEYESLMDHCSVEIGDLVMSRNQSVGIASYVDSDEPFVLGQDTVLIKPFEVDSKFVFYKLQSEVVQRSIVKLAGGSTFSRINLADIRKLKLNLPPLPEQKKIAQILSTWDEAITTTEQLLANSQQQKKALMQQLLTGKKRLLDTNGVRFSGEWRERLLGNISKITTGSSNRQDSHMNGAYTFFDRSEDIRTSDTYLFDCEAVIVPGEGQDFIPKYFVGKFDLHQRTYAIMDFPECHGKFLFYAIHYFRSHFLTQAVGSTVKSLRLPMFQKMKLRLPIVEEQQKIATVLSCADKEITALQQKLDALKQEKKALMQQLLTGKRQVKIDNKEVA